MEQTTTPPQATENSQNPLHEVTREERIALYKEVLSKFRDLSEPLGRLAVNTEIITAIELLGNFNKLQGKIIALIAEAMNVDLEELTAEPEQN